MDGITCTSDTCPCRTARQAGQPIGSLINDQQHTDYIVFPLFAGTLARCVLASRPLTPPSPIDTLLETGIVDHARIILKLADAASEPDGWERDRDAFTTIVHFVLAAWDVFLRWVPEHYVTLGCSWDGTSQATLLKAARDWMRPNRERSLTELVLFTADVANRLTSRRPELPLESRAIRPLRVEIAARLRARGLTTWPRVLQASAADWHTATLETLLQHYAADPLAVSRNALASLGVDFDPWDPSLDEYLDDEPEEPDESADPDPPESPPTDAPVGTPDAGLEQMLAEALAEIDRGEARCQAIEGERLKLADRCAGLQGRVERLTSDLSASQTALREMETLMASLRRERDELADRLVAEEVLTGVRPSAPPDAFAGCRVCVFVGGPSGDVREELAARFSAFGATGVTVYDIDRERGPDAYPPHAIVVLGVATMGHSASEYVLGRARASRVWYFRGGYGATRLAAAAAAAYSARRAAGGTEAVVTATRATG